MRARVVFASILTSVLLTLAAAVVVPSPARAEDKREVKARQLFAVGKYAEALEIFGNLYAETLHPTYLRNVGRCYQNLGEPDKAISSFSEYLRQSKSITPVQREQVQGYIREMEELKRKRKLEQAQESQPLPQQTAEAGKKAAPPPRLAATDPDAASSARSKPLVTKDDPDAAISRRAAGGDSESSPFYTRWWFWTAAAVLIGGGAAAVVLLQPRTPETATSFGTMSAHPR